MQGKERTKKRIVSDLHAYLLGEIKKNARQRPEDFNVESYLGNSDFSYHVSTPIKRKIAKNFLKQHPEFSGKDFVTLLTSLYQSKSDDEKSLAGKIIEYSSSNRAYITPEHIDFWLNNLKGWAQVDSLCQSSFSAGELLSRWSAWRKFLIQLSKSSNINKRRASMVLLVKSVFMSKDSRITELAFNIIGRLEIEKPILITKAVSWLLRSLTALHPKEVRVYLHEHASTLPKIAIRETIRKLNTGRK